MRAFVRLCLRPEVPERNILQTFLGNFTNFTTLIHNFEMKKSNVQGDDKIRYGLWIVAQICLPQQIETDEVRADFWAHCIIDTLTYYLIIPKRKLRLPLNQISWVSE